MKPRAALLAASMLAWSIAPTHAAGPDAKAAQHAMEQQRKAMEQEIKRQQESEKKMMEQQRRAMQEQIKAERKFMEAQQKAYQHQQKAMHEQQQKAAAGQPHPATATHTAPTGPYHHGSPYHHRHYATHNRTPYRHLRQMPTQVDPETQALHQLKHALDAVKHGNTASPASKSAIQHALMGVVEVQKVPTVAAIESLSGHLANGLANRESPTAETGPMALTLRGLLNSPELQTNEVVEIMNEHRAALRASKVRPAELASIMESLKTISNQERAHR